VSDRFGDYGLTGVVMFRMIGDALEVDTFLLSCRVLGRGVEHVVMIRLAEEARKRGASLIVGQIRTTARNQPARQFLHSLPAEIHEDRYSLPVEAASRIGWTPAEPASPPAPSAAQPPQVNRPDYAHIAKHLATAPDILAALRAEARGNDAVKTVAWESETEAALATIWSELLHVSLINPNDNFFDLGGHSLVVVLLIVRLREVLGVELPIEDVYSGDMTLRALARTIDRHKAGGDAEYQALVEEIERMSDDEVARLLAEESDAYPADL
jgi:acyl carrier protein